MIYKVWVHIEQIDESKDHYEDIGLPYQAGVFKTEVEAANFVENELLLNNFDERESMTKSIKNRCTEKKLLQTTTLKEQCPDVPVTEIKVDILSEGGQLWLRPEGFGEKCSADGKGYPIGLEIWQGKLRLVVFDDINKEDPQIIDMERAKESCRIEVAQECNDQCADKNYYAAVEYLTDQGRKLFTGPMKGGLWNGRCLDACLMSKKQNDKVAYEFLLKFGDQYVRDLPDNQKLLWQKTKDTAATMLKPAKSCSTANAQPRKKIR